MLLSCSIFTQRQIVATIEKPVAENESHFSTPEYDTDIDVITVDDNDINDLIFRAMDFVNINYRYGGSTPKEGFDCSGLVQYLFREQLQVSLPRTTRTMHKTGQHIAKKQLIAGDLVFFNTQKRRYSHVGLYIGNNRFIHAPRRGAKVRIENMNIKYWDSRFNGGRRVVETALAN